MLNPIFKDSEIFKVEKSLISIFGPQSPIFRNSTQKNPIKRRKRC